MSNSRLYRWCWKCFNFGSLLFKGRTLRWLFVHRNLNICIMHSAPKQIDLKWFIFHVYSMIEWETTPDSKFYVNNVSISSIVSNADTIATVQSKYELYRNENSLFLASSGLSYLCWITITMPKVHFQPGGPVHLVFQTDSDDIFSFSIEYVWKMKRLSSFHLFIFDIWWHLGDYRFGRRSSNIFLEETKKHHNNQEIELE